MLLKVWAGERPNSRRNDPSGPSEAADNPRQIPVFVRTSGDGARDIGGRVGALNALINGLKVLIIADALFSWVVADNEFPRTMTKPVLDPVYAPVRLLLKPLTGSVDLSPLIALGLLFALQMALRPDPER